MFFYVRLEEERHDVNQAERIFAGSEREAVLEFIRRRDLSTAFKYQIFVGEGAYCEYWWQDGFCQHGEKKSVWFVGDERIEKIA